jgi:hypothetical protein
MLEDTMDFLVQEVPESCEYTENQANATELAVIKPFSLNEESKELIERIISETDEQKSRDLTHLFNANQNKKTMVRVNKLSDLLDTITDQALQRFSARPDEISNKELFDGLKVVQDLIERGQKQVAGAGEVPLIQVNQQTNEVNIGGTSSTLSRDSRERVKTAVLDFLNSISTQSATLDTADASNIVQVNAQEGDIVDVE